MWNSRIRGLLRVRTAWWPEPSALFCSRSRNDIILHATTNRRSREPERAAGTTKYSTPLRTVALENQSAQHRLDIRKTSCNNVSMQSAHYARLSRNNHSRLLLDHRCRCVHYNPEGRGCQSDAKYLPFRSKGPRRRRFSMAYYGVFLSLAIRAEGLLRWVNGWGLLVRFSSILTPVARESALFGAMTATICTARTTCVCNISTDGYEETLILSECVPFRSSCLFLTPRGELL